MIEKLVLDLPEVYQPIYGHPDFSTTASRPCADRLKQIEQIYKALERLLNRPLNILDLGCAQGFFSLNLAKLGAVVHGIDYLGKNIALCQALAMENPDLHASFAESRIEDLVPTLQNGQYDLVLGLSVFHHIIHTNGAPSVKFLLEQIAQVSGVLVLEMALKSEPMFWGASQPTDPRELIHDIGFLHLVGHHGTHLTSIPRPLYISSAHYCVLDEMACQFDSWSFDSHAFANGTTQKSRRYFMCEDRIVKTYRLDHPLGSHNKAEYSKEVALLSAPPGGFETPKLIAHGENSIETWLAMERLPGCLLLDLILEGVDFNPREIILSVLKQLATLENEGLYHNDVRVWNVLIDRQNGGAHLIDFGSISLGAKDCVWPSNLFLAFFIFIKEVVTASIDTPTPFRKASISPYGLPEPYCAWALSLWQMPINEWSFNLMLKTLQNFSTANSTANYPKEPIGVWMKAIEEAIQIQKQYTNQLIQTKQAQVESMAAQIASQETQYMDQLRHALTLMQTEQANVERLSAQIVGQETQYQNHLRQVVTLAQTAQEQSQHLSAQLVHHIQQAEAAAKGHAIQINSLQKSISWRITAPLRRLSFFLKRK